jgi:hypothetical protein
MTTKKILRRGIPFSAEVAPLVARMPAVDEYRESLLRLQGVWDSLSMLGQMSGTLPDIVATRSAFQALTEKLLDSLGRCLLTNVVQQMRNQGQVAIDILVRNLFERTADIGFLSTDTDVREFMQAHTGTDAPDAELQHRLETRFADYAAKYTVYDDIVVLTPEGRVRFELIGVRMLGEHFAFADLSEHVEGLRRPDGSIAAVKLAVPAVFTRAGGELLWLDARPHFWAARD